LISVHVSVTKGKDRSSMGMNQLVYLMLRMGTTIHLAIAFWVFNCLT
jgi:hypothetical protein